MARAASKVATKPKKIKARATRRLTGMAAIPVNNWDHAKYYTHYEVETREWIASVKSYVKKFLDKKQQAAINKLPDWKLSYSHWAAASYLLVNESTIVPDLYKTGLTNYLDKLVKEGKYIIGEKTQKEKQKKNVHIPTIQERLMEAAEEKTAEIEEWIDDFLRDPKKNTLKDKTPITIFRKNEINLGHTRWIQKWYEGPYSEIEELLSLPKSNLTDDQSQLVEGYRHFTKAQQKEISEFYKRIFQAIEILRAEKKQLRPPRKVKQKSAAELVKKLKFKTSDPEMGIASVNPADIIDATAIVVFNCKNRKLGIYYAEAHQTIQVKGNTLQYFDEGKSLQKTIRKPQEILPSWKKITKHKLDSMFGFLKTTETKLNGRFNEDTVILKVFK